MQQRLPILFSLCPLSTIISASADLSAASDLPSSPLQEVNFSQVCLEQKVQVWRTACDQSKLFERQSEDVNVSCPNTDPDSDKPDVLITVNPNKTFQTMVGFGGALTASSAYVIRKAPAAVQEGVLKKIFGSLEEGGANFKMVRIAIGASDFSLLEGTRRPSYDEHMDDFSLQHFSISLHDKDVQPLLKRMRVINPNVSLVASPWTGPLWMKTDHSNGRGTLIHKNYKVYARYLAKYLLHYQSENISIEYLTLQNEPGHGYCGPDMPCMPMSAENQNELGLRFLSEREEHGLTTRVLAYDHNWEMSWGEWLSAIGFYGLHCSPTWAVCGMLGLAAGLWIATSPERVDRMKTKVGRMKTAVYGNRCVQQFNSSACSARVIRAARRIPQMGSRTKLNSVSRTLSEPDRLSSLLGKERKLEPLSPTNKSPNSNFCERLTDTATRTFETNYFRYGVYSGAAFLLFGRLLGWIATRFAERFGNFDPGMGSGYPERLLNLPGSDLVFDGIAWHCYGGQPDAMGRLHQLFPWQEHHVTECSGGSWSNNNDFAADLLLDANRIIDSVGRNWAASYQKFNLVLDESGGPFCANSVCCQTCRPLLTIPSWASSMEDVKVEEDYYALVHHSAFLETGAQVVYSEASSDKVQVVAYQNPGGSLVIVAANMVWNSKNMKIRVLDASTNRSFDVTSPAGLATFVW